MPENGSPSTNEGHQNKTPRIRNKIGSIEDVIIGTAVVLIIFIIIGIFIYFIDLKEPSPRLNMLITGTVGGTFGWSTGILLSPYHRSEEKDFRGLGKIIYGFITGYLFAKILDPLLSDVTNQNGFTQIPLPVIYNITIGTISFIAIATLTYVSRKYWL